MEVTTHNTTAYIFWPNLYAAVANIAQSRVMLHVVVTHKVVIGELWVLNLQCFVAAGLAFSLPKTLLK